MAADLLAELKRELRGEVKGLDNLDAKAHRQLLDLLQAAHQHQRRALDRALGEVLDHIPALLRGPARAIFFRE